MFCQIMAAARALLSRRRNSIFADISAIPPHNLTTFAGPEG